MPSEIHDESKGLLFTTNDLLEYKGFKARPIISGGLLEVGTRLELFGAGGTWKSQAAIHLAYCIANGVHWLGFSTFPAVVIYLQGEMTIDQTRIRVAKYCEGTKSIYLDRHPVTDSNPDEIDRIYQKAVDFAYPQHVIFITTGHKGQFISLDDFSAPALLKYYIKILSDKYPGLPIVLIIDPLYKMVTRDITKQAEAIRFTRNIDEVLQDEFLQLAVVYIHHSRKGVTDTSGMEIQQGANDSFGSKMISDWWPEAVLRTNLWESDKIKARKEGNTEVDETKRTVDILFPKFSRIGAEPPPSKIQVRWDRATLHPHILRRFKTTIPDDEAEGRLADLSHLE